MAKKTPRIERKAVYETNVVTLCRDRYKDKLDEVNAELERDNAQLKVCLEKGKLSTDEEEKRALAREVKKIRDKIEIFKGNEFMFRETVDLFDKLVDILDSLMMREQYRIIVRKIPEKKLPDLVRDLKREKLNELLMELIRVLDVANKKSMLSSKELKEQLHTRAIENANFMERNAPNEDDIDAIIAEFESDTATVTATVVNETSNVNNVVNNN